MARPKGSKNKKHNWGDYVRGDGKHVPPGKNTLGISVDTSGFGQLLANLSDAAGDAVRPAAQAGIQVIYDQIKMNVLGLANAPLKVAALGAKTGNLKDSIYQVYSKSNSEDGKVAEYHASWNARKAPHGHLVEYGHMMRYRTFIVKDGPKKGQWVTVKSEPLAAPRQVAAHPFVRPAIAQKEGAARAAMEEVLLTKMQEAADES
jgi:hypothetical protein